MPRIELSGKFYDIVDCEICGRTVYVVNEAAIGFIAPCGRRLVNIYEPLMNGVPTENDCLARSQGLG